MRIIIPVVLLVVGISVSCRQRPESLDAGDYQQWIQSGESGLVNGKKINGVALKASYVPAEYLAYREYISSPSDSVSYDSLLNSYRCGMTFKIELSAEKNNPRYQSLNYYNISSQEEFAARIQNLSFHLEDFISLEHSELKFSPVLSNFEGFDELGNRMTFTVVFQVPEFNCGSPTKDFGDVTLTFNDPYWDLGTNNFLFESKSLVNVPKLNF